MKPAPKYTAAALLYRIGAEGIWEYDLFDRLCRAYPAAELRALREDLVGMSTVGWLDVVAERQHSGQILRRYALRPEVRPFLEFQLDLARFDNLLGGVA
jgi:hypothetical protein